MAQARDRATRPVRRPRCSAPRGTTTTPRGRSASAPPTAPRTPSSPGAVISAVGQLNRPNVPEIPGQDDFAGPSFHSARWDHDVDLAGPAGGDDRRRRERVPDRSRRSPTRSGTSRSSSGPPSGCSRTPTTTRRSAPASSGPCATCRSTGAGTGSSSSGPCCDEGLEAARVDPDYPHQQQAVSEANDFARLMFTDWINEPGRRRPRAARQGRARLPGHRQADAAGQRELAANADP